MSKIKSTELSALIKWGHKNGVNTSNVQVSNFVATGRGMGITHRMYQNECVLEIPSSILITGPTILKSSKLSSILSSTGETYDMQDCFLTWGWVLFKFFWLNFTNVTKISYKTRFKSLFLRRTTQTPLTSILWRVYQRHLHCLFSLTLSLFLYKWPSYVRGSKRNAKHLT